VGRKVEGNGADFCRRLPWKRKFVWNGLTGVSELDEERLAKVAMVTTGCSQHYGGFRVTIVNKKSGAIDQTHFSFNDHLDRSLGARTDGRTDHDSFMVISYIAWDWYIAKPKTARPFCKAVEDHINLFL
jgi:hypothetical protein